MKAILFSVVLLALAPSLPAADQSCSVIRDSDQPRFAYRHDPAAFKPYVAELFTPGGKNVLRDMVPDHIHHHGLMFAVAADSVDFWGETGKCGRQVSRRFEATSTGVTQQLDWTTPDGETVLIENRSVQLAPNREVTLLTWRSRLNPATGAQTVKLTGSHYFGLGARFAVPMQKASRFIHAGAQPGEVVRGDERLTPSPWCACIGPVDGITVTIAFFDDPKNLRHPARMFTMNEPFAYLSATLNLWKAPLDLGAEAPLALRYGVAAWDGEISPEQIEKLYRQWAAADSSRQ